MEIAQIEKDARQRERDKWILAIQGMLNRANNNTTGLHPEYRKGCIDTAETILRMLKGV